MRNNKPQKNVDGQGWKNLARITNFNQYLSQRSFLLVLFSCYTRSLTFDTYFVQLFLDEVKAYEPKVEAMLEESQELVESSKLDKTDIDGVDKTKTALSSRWKAVNDHLKERQRK